VSDDPLGWPLDVFEDTLIDIALIELDARGKRNHPHEQTLRRAQAERERRRLLALGLPPLYSDP
jgi:hypothetical protein